MRRYFLTLLGCVFMFLFSGCQGSDSNIIKCPEKGCREEWKVLDETLYEDDEVDMFNTKIFSNIAEADTLTKPICYCKVYDVIYYINYLDHNYIYRCKDGEIKKAVAIPADNLYSYKGNLYFRVEDSNFYKLKGMKEGDIFKYSPATGELVMVASTTSEWLMLSNNCIYYYEREMADEDSFYPHLKYYDLENESITKIVNLSTVFSLWKDYYVTPFSIKKNNGWRIDGVGLYKRGITEIDYERVSGRGPDVEPLISGTGNFKYCVDKNTLYCEKSEEIVIIQLDTKEVQSIPKKLSTIDFTICEDNLYLLHTGKIECISLSNPTSENGYYDMLKLEETDNISRLFSINGEVYGLRYAAFLKSGIGQGVPEIVRIKFLENSCQLFPIGK